MFDVVDFRMIIWEQTALVLVDCLVVKEAFFILIDLVDEAAQ